MKAIQLTEELHSYIEKHCPLPHDILDELRQRTAERSDAVMQVSLPQASFMNFMCRLTNAKKAVEVGCFTGYSAIAIASALGDGGELYTLDINPETMAIAKDFFERANLSAKIKPQLGNAIESLEKLVQEDAGRFDFAFIDADKVGYESYFESCLKLVRKGGLIAVDNVLWSGSVVDPTDQSPDTCAIRDFNEARRIDDRVEAVMVNIADGIYLLRKL